mgnify:CR=1 FL=1
MRLSWVLIRLCNRVSLSRYTDAELRAQQLGHHGVTLEDVGYGLWRRWGPPRLVGTPVRLFRSPTWRIRYDAVEIRLLNLITIDTLQHNGLPSDPYAVQQAHRAWCRAAGQPEP